MKEGLALNILSIQSSVAYGHVGNSAAVFPLQRLGFSVWPVNTVHFSNHTGYGHWRGPILSADDVAEVVRGIEDRGVLPECDAVLSGYVGDASLGRVVLDAVAKVKAANLRAVYCCDPVMGNTGRRFFVRPGIPEFLRGERTEEALSKTASSVYAVLEETHRAHSQEMRLIAAQDAIADPPDRFPARRLR